MPTTYKILGQSNPTANTLTTVYTVPATNSAVISTITVANLSGTENTRYKLAVVRSGQNIANNNYIAFNTTVLSHDSIALTLGLTLAANDSIRANVETSNIAINVFGSEIY